MSNSRCDCCKWWRGRRTDEAREEKYKFDLEYIPPFESFPWWMKIVWKARLKSYIEDEKQRCFTEASQGDCKLEPTPVTKLCEDFCSHHTEISSITEVE